MSSDRDKPDDNDESLEIDIADTTAFDVGSANTQALHTLDTFDRRALDTETHALVLDNRELVELDAELDAAFEPINTPPPRESATLFAQSSRPPTPLPPTRPTRNPESRSTYSALSCPTCNGPVELKSRHVAVFGGAVRVYCSATCLEQRDALPAEATTSSIALPPKKHRVWWVLASAFVAAACVTGFFLTNELRDLRHARLIPPAPAVSATQTPADPEPSAVNDPQKEADAALTAELMHDAWIHPLAGPTRRMPHNHNGAFGAERGGERPPECVSGHCGVDVGYMWGEPVHAVHDGVIDFVNRGPNEERGGVFVRIAHRGGTLFSWYFHLAAVPRWIKAGEKVSAGQVIGLLGDTGVKHSAPHLHFALSVKTSKHVSERYLDPEPLIAIWPLWIPNEDNTGGALSTTEEPGLPVRASGGGSRRKHRAAATESTAEGTNQLTNDGTSEAVATPSSGKTAQPAGASPTRAVAPDGPTGTNN